MTSSPSPQDSWPQDLDAFVPVPELADGVVRLAFNESPWGPFPAALAAIRARAPEASRYPELDGRLIDRLAEVHCLAPEMIALGNGADAIIGYLSAAFLRRGDEVITGWPSFPTYVTDAVKQQARVVFVPLRNGACDLEAMVARIGPRTRLVWVCTPNNPTGATVSPESFHAFLDAVPERVLVVVDEAYFEFAAGAGVLDAVGGYVRERPNVAALRTFSKLYGLAGLRVGWLAGPAPIIAAVGRSRHYYDVGSLPAIAALASLDDVEEVERRRAENDRLRALLEAGLGAQDRRWLPSQANFLAVDVGDAERASERLLTAGVATRSLAGLGSPRLLRITVGSEAQIGRVLELLGGPTR